MIQTDYSQALAQLPGQNAHIDRPAPTNGDDLVTVIKNAHVDGNVA